MSAVPIWDFAFDKWTFNVPYLSAQTFELVSPTPAVVAFGSIALYVLAVFVIFPALKPKSEAVATKFAFLHHAALCVYSTVCFVATLAYMFQAGQLESLDATLCTPLPAWLRLLSLTFTASKVWEWLDTACMLWAGKTLDKIDFLHLYHHATTFLLFLHVMNLPGTEKSGMLLNGFVHSIMYYHYAWRLPRALRPLITGAQIVQLAVVTWFWTIIPARCPQFASYPAQHPLEFAVPYLCVPVYLLLFVKFFFTSYVCKKPADGPKPAAGKGKTE